MPRTVTAADILTRHQPAWDFDDCPPATVMCNNVGCGFAIEMDEQDQWREEFAHHQADVLLEVIRHACAKAVRDAADALEREDPTDTAKYGVAFPLGFLRRRADTIHHVPARARGINLTRSCTLCDGDIHIIDGERQRHVCTIPTYLGSTGRPLPATQKAGTNA